MDLANLLILGASARAAAFSALRAGLRPWCADLFADADLKVRCPAIAVAPGKYPEGLLEIAREAPPAPWMYTGALENRPALVCQIAQHRPLWGNDGHVLRNVRSPSFVAGIARSAGIPFPAIRDRAARVPRDGRWLVKPRAGAGGAGIRFWKGERINRSQKAIYFQKFIEGEACAAVYVGDGDRAQLLGVTQQLVGEDWLHAAPFHYSGSIGPLDLKPGERQSFERLGMAVASGCRLQGLFGIDCVLRDGIPWPVEVNPRYTASIEVLEYALLLPALALHQKVFAPEAAVPSLSLSPLQPRIVGKAILFARAPLVFPVDGPWQQSLRAPPDLWELPAFADIPAAGQPIKAGRPILTFFACAGSLSGCRDTLRQIARDLDRWLFR